MTVSAHTVAAELRRRVPSISTTQLHKLLYYCQGHHIAAFGAPLFEESIVAWDMGPVVGALWQRERGGIPVIADEDLDEAGLNTVGFVLSRYGRLSARDLVNLTHSEPPWADANAQRRPGGSIPITHESLRAFFASSEEVDDELALDDETLSRLVEGAEARRREPAQADSLEEIQRRITALSR